MNKKKYLRNIVVILAIFAILLLIITRKEIFDANDTSRIATIESLVERGTFNIENTEFVNFENITDKFYLNCSEHLYNNCGKYYSEKPPVLSFIGAGVYFILNKVFGLRFYNMQDSYSYYLLTLFTAGISSLVLIFFFYKSLTLINIKEKFRILLTVSLAFGTVFLFYSGIFSNHVVSASFLFISFYFLLKIKFEKSKNLKADFFLSGLFVSFATTIEYVAGIFMLLFFLSILLNKKIRKFIIYFGAGCLIPLIPHFILNYIVTGSLKPAYMICDAMAYPSSIYPKIHKYNEIYGPTKLESVFYILFGKQGLFSNNPVLIIPFIYLLLTAFSRRYHELRKEARIVLVSIILILTYYISQHFTINGMGGDYGFRVTILFIPLIMFFGAEFFKENKSKNLFFIYYASLIIALLAVLGVTFNISFIKIILTNPYISLIIVFLVVLIKTIKSKKR